MSLPRLPSIPQDLSKRPESFLSTLRTRLDACDDAITSALIEAGRGYERSSETLVKSGQDELSTYFARLRSAFSAWYAERNARLTYHGNLKPIRK